MPPETLRSKLDGIQGVGQVAGPNLTLVRDYVKQFGDIIKGMDARSSTFIWEKLFSLTLWLSPRPYGADAKDGLPPPALQGGRRFYSFNDTPQPLEGL